VRRCSLNRVFSGRGTCALGLQLTTTSAGLRESSPKFANTASSCAVISSERSGVPSPATDATLERRASNSEDGLRS
jgi:hypothetical protein